MEIELAQQMGKTIIVIEAWGSKKTSTVMIKLPTKLLNGIQILQ